eukprot:gene12412-19544_t
MCCNSWLFCAALLPVTLACDSLGVLPSATADGIGGMPKGATITLDSGLVIPQVPLTYAHAGSRPFWAHPYGGYSEGINEFGRCKTAAEAVATLTELVTLYGQTCRTCPEAADYNSLFMVANAGFDFGMVYGDQEADPSRQERSAGLLRDLAEDHKLTKVDLMLTLSDHSYGGKENAHEPRGKSLGTQVPIRAWLRIIL